MVILEYIQRTTRGMKSNVGQMINNDNFVTYGTTCLCQQEVILKPIENTCNIQG
jgi:hypothetical protein